MGKCHRDHHGYDIEAAAPAGDGLYPYMIETPQLRWAFIRKVYTIVSIQILITGAVSAVINFVPPIRGFFLERTAASLAVLIVIVISPLILMIPMVLLRNKHPVNLILLMLFTVCISFSVGMACITAHGRVVLEATALTLVVVVGLTLYTFWAAKRGYDFNFLGPFLCAALLILMLYGLIQFLFPMGRVAHTIYGCVAALVFSGFIIYDTDNLIKRHTYDEYISAAITLYLDIINLFIALLTIFTGTDS